MEEWHINKDKAQGRIVRLYKQYQKTGDKNYLEDIQKAVDVIGESFTLLIDGVPGKQKRWKIVFKPRKGTKSGIVLLH